MRAHALSGSKALAAVVLILSLGPLGANVVRAVFSTLTYLMFRRCASHQGQLGLGYKGIVNPLFGCMPQENTPSESGVIGYVHHYVLESPASSHTLLQL